MVMGADEHSWRNVRGESLALPVTKDYADEMTLVADTGDLWTVRGTTDLDPTGKPHVTIEVGEGMGLHHGGPKQTRHYRWTGEEWSGGSTTDLPEKSVGDMQVFSATEVNLLLGGNEVAWWHSTNGGRTFSKGDTWVSRKRTRFALSSLIRNAHPDARIIAAGNNNAEKNDFREMYLLGDNGPVKRPKSEANQLAN